MKYKSFKEMREGYSRIFSASAKAVEKRIKNTLDTKYILIKLGKELKWLR